MLRLNRAPSTLIFALLLFPITASAQHESQGYLPLTQSEIGRKFPVRYVGTAFHGDPKNLDLKTEKPLPDRLAIGVSGTTVTKTEDEDLVFKGQDRQNKTWSVQLGFSFDCRFFESDLDKNGILDGLLLCPTGGNGLAPSRHLVALTFDQEGKPVTFEADGYFEETAKGIFDLVDLNRDGRAELIYMNFNDGYWVTNLYHAKNGRWERVAGRFGNRVFPLYTRFTLRDNHTPTRPNRGRNPFAPDLSNAVPTLHGRLISYHWANVSASEDMELKINDAQGREIISKPTSWFSSFAVVIDGIEGRKIVLLSADEKVMQSFLTEIVERKYDVELYGNRQRDVSSPELLWANVR
jgi:hypothetical protein